ncbi:hypothetical protein ABPG75_000132 [Micractinium tetrahymenae]
MLYFNPPQLRWLQSPADLEALLAADAAARAVVVAVQFGENFDVRDSHVTRLVEALGPQLQSIYLGSREGAWDLLWPWCLKEAVKKAAQEVHTLQSADQQIQRLRQLEAELEGHRRELASLQASVYGLSNVLGDLAGSLVRAASLDRRAQARELHRQLAGEAELLSLACESFIERAQALSDACAKASTLSPRAGELSQRMSSGMLCRLRAAACQAASQGSGAAGSDDRILLRCTLLGQSVERLGSCLLRSCTAAAPQAAH